MLDGRIYGEAGGNAVHQVAYTLAAFVEHIENLKEKGLSIQEIFNKTVIGLSISSQFFPEIAKIRAVKFLLLKIAEVYRVDPKDATIKIFAETTAINKSKLDCYSNILRTGGEAFAASIGGVQILRISPFDSVFGKTSHLGVRLSRNIHHMLKEESRIEHVMDPARGSFYIEKLTNELAEKAWHQFLNIEKEGGFLKALKNGTIQKQIEDNRKKLQSDLITGKHKLLVPINMQI